MTTTSTFSGINEDSKTSSRVLKPPGGGSSNIFGPGEASPSPKQRPGNCKPSEAGIFKPSSSDTSMKNAAQRSARDGDDSFNRIFGEANSSPNLCQKGTSASPCVNTHVNLFGGRLYSPKSHVHSETNSTHNHIFGQNDTIAGGEGQVGGYSERERGSYNPITGADYKDLAPNHHALHVKHPQKRRFLVLCNTVIINLYETQQYIMDKAAHMKYECLKISKELPKPQKEQPPLPCSDGEYQAKEGKMQNVQTSTRITNPPGGKTHKLW